MTPALGTEPLIRDAEALQAALRARAEELRIPRLTIDAVGGLASGHSAKLLSSIPLRAIGVTSLPLLLGALGVALRLVEDPETAGRVASLPRRKSSERSAPPVSRIMRRVLAEAGRAGGLERARRLSPEQRQEISRKGARARWRKHRQRRKQMDRDPSAFAAEEISNLRNGQERLAAARQWATATQGSAAAAAIKSASDLVNVEQQIGVWRTQRGGAARAAPAGSPATPDRPSLPVHERTGKAGFRRLREEREIQERAAAAQK
jgi:hypothetical protein